MEGTDNDSSDDELYVNYMSKNYVILQKKHLLRAIETILQPQDKKLVGRRAKIRSSYSHRDAIKVESNCTDRTSLNLAALDNRISHKSDNYGLTLIFNEMKLCLLARDWDSYKELLAILLTSPNLSNDYVLFIIRSCFVLIFNHPYRTPGLLDNFIASCLKINDESRKIQYLKNCFLLKGDSICKSRENILKIENDEEEEEEEELFFNPDFSSDEDD